MAETQHAVKVHLLLCVLVKVYCSTPAGVALVLRIGGSVAHDRCGCLIMKQPSVPS
jgi:hypothetical protein